MELLTLASARTGRDRESITARRWWLIGLAGAVLAVTAFAIESSYLQTMSRHGTGVFGWELARTSHRTRSILAGWGRAGRSAARTASWIDFAFILGYAGLLVGVAKALGRGDACRLVRGSAAITRSIAGLVVAAGAVNLTAKLIQLAILGGHTGQPFPAAGFFAAVLNYVLLAGAILGCLWLLVSRRRQRDPGVRPNG